MTADQIHTAVPRIFGLILLLLLLPIAQVHAADIAVSATCSLADAITSANTDTVTGGCPAGSGADTITLSGNVKATETLPDITSDITIVGGGFLINQDNDADSLLRTLAGSKLTLQNLTLFFDEGDATSTDPEGALQLGDSATLTDVTLLYCEPVCVRANNSGATFIFTSVYFDTEINGYFVPAAIWAEAGTFTLTKMAFREIYIGAESLIRVNSGAQVTLNGCLFIHRVLAKLKSGSGALTDSSSDCAVGTTIGNGYTVPEIPTDEDKPCGELHQGWPVMSVSDTVTRKIVLTEDCDLTSRTVVVPHNLHLTISSAAGQRYAIKSAPNYDMFLVGGKLTLRNVDLVGRNLGGQDTLDKPLLAIDAWHAEDISLTDVTIRPTAGGTPGYRSGFKLIQVGATTLTRVTVQDLVAEPGDWRASVMTLIGANDVLITDSTFSNNGGGPAAFRAYSAGSRIHLAGENTFTDNSPLNFGGAYTALTGCSAGPLPENVVSYCPPPAEDTEDEAEEESSGRRRASTPEVKATALPVHTCLSLPANIAVRATFGLSSGIQCRQLAPWQTGLAGARDAVDLWAYVEQGAEVCFLGSGRLVFLDAAYAPRLVSDLPAYGRNGMTCAEINRPGSVVLMPGPPAPLQTVETANTASSHLQGCMVTTNDILNFRAGPAGEVIGLLPYNVTLTALERVPGWFKVDYFGTRGWISADYVEPKGGCG